MLCLDVELLKEREEWIVRFMGKNKNQNHYKGGFNKISFQMSLTCGGFVNMLQSL